jgi:outer membrane lipopolysaccharide assembly protein LptE/RlpB
MKYRIIKMAALLALVVHLSSCFHHVRTNRRMSPHFGYHRAGRNW